MNRKMKETWARFLMAAGIGSCYLWLLLRPQAASEAAIASLRLCAVVIVPSLFPFFVCTNLFCALRLTEALERVLARVMEPVFGVPGSGAAALAVGLTGGYPSGAQAAASLYESSGIDKKTAGRLLLFCNNCGPAFIFGVAGHTIFQSALAGLLLYAVHVTAALLLGVFSRKKQKSRSVCPQSRKEVSSVSFSQALTASVKKAGQTALEVCMFVVVFGILTAMAQSALHSFLPAWALAALAGILELSGGVSQLAGLTASQGVKFTLASFFLAFGGLSVHAQTKTVLSAAGLDGLPVFLPKLLHALTAAVLSVPVYLFFHSRLSSAPVFAGTSPNLLYAALQSFGCLAACLFFRKMAGSNLKRNRV